MDYSLLTAAGTAISTAMGIGKAAIEIRDFNQMTGTIAKINEQLLKAQESLFAHNAQLNTLQQENFSLTNRLRELEGKAAENNRYTLVEISDRTFVLGLKQRVNIATENIGNPSEPHHYLCQPCFAGGVKSVLQKASFCGAVSLYCPICKTSFSTGETE